MANDNIFELLSQQKFNNIEEINEFINKNIKGKKTLANNSLIRILIKVMKKNPFI